MLAFGVLGHGWPDDARTWDRVLPTLHAAGPRTVVPYLRGFGATRFRNPETMRSGQLAALGQDALDRAHALALPRPRVRSLAMSLTVAPGRWLPVRAGGSHASQLGLDTVAAPR